MRVTAMVMVVIYHCVSYYCVWDFPGFRSDIYGIFAKFLNYIDMPAFVFVSGYLYSFNLLGGGNIKIIKNSLRENARGFYYRI